MSIWIGDVTLDVVRRWGPDTLAGHLGIEITALGDDWIEGTMLVDRRTQQPYGILHGGASVALAETLGSCGANLALDRSRFRAVGQEIGASHLRPVAEGYVTGRATPVELGRHRQFWRIEIRDARGRLTCLSNLTLAVVEAR